MKYAVVSQKGGVGKSTLSRLLAVAYAKAEYSTLLADLDVGQGTSTAWNDRRRSAEIKPEITVLAHSLDTIEKKYSALHDVVVFDGAAKATKTTGQVAKVADLVVIPSGLALDDLLPSVQLAHEIKGAGLKPAKICFVLCRVGGSEAELQEARDYLSQTPYNVCPHYLPERTAYRRASDAGLSALETPYETLNARADEIADYLHTLGEGK